MFLSSFKIIYMFSYKVLTNYVSMYICTLCDGNIYISVPAPSVTVHTPKNQIVGQSLTLKCDITTVRGITSNVNLIWSSNGVNIKRTEGINVNSRTSNSLLYKDSYNISQLSTDDENRTYNCMAVIATPSPVKTTESVTLNVTSKLYLCIYMCSYILLFC